MSWGETAQDSTVTEAGPALAASVRAGGAEPTLMHVSDTICGSRDVSNSYAISTPGGTVVINAGTEAGGKRHRRLYDEAGLAPYRYLILTQSHTDHIGGLGSFLDTGLELVAQATLPQVRGYWMGLSEFYTGRSDRLWRRIVGARSPGHQREFVARPDILVDKRLTLEVGGRELVLVSVPGGETLDSLAVWLPDERTVFTGNLLGPLWLHVPNLYTVRGDRIRSALGFVDSVQAVMDLDAEVLVTGHGDPIWGAEQIREGLTRIRDGVLHIHDETVAGMNAGKDVNQLMQEIRLPEELSLGEGHGKVTWDVRSIWEEYAGWFHYDSTTSLYAVPRSAVAADLVELAGAQALLDRASAYVTAGKPLEALHLLDVLTDADALPSAGLQVKKAALEALLDASGRINLSETMWLTTEIQDIEDRQRDADG